MDWQLTCRVCMESGDMVSLFDWDENNEQLADKYTYCCGLTVDKNDDLPSLICLSCVDKLTYSYQFKQQCLSSVETLKECLEEFVKTSSVIENPSKSAQKQTETITIKQEDGVFLQYELPVETEQKWTRTVSKASERAVVTKAPGPRKRGRPRKYPNEQGNIDISTYNRKKPQDHPPEHTSLTTLLEMNEAEMKTEPDDAELGEEEALDDDYQLSEGSDAEEAEESEDKDEPATPRKRGRPCKTKVVKVKRETTLDDMEDVLLKETIMAYSEPLPDHILHPKPKTKKKYTPKVKAGADKLYTCETCGASFTSNASLQAHIRRHLGIKPFVCSICGYACVTKEALKRHMLRHTGERPYKCRICERRFGDFGTRQKHERLHMGVRPYQCSVCGKSFTYSYVLSNHMLTHTGEKKYSCGPCNKKFTKSHHLKYHNKVHHKDLYQQQQLEAQVKKLRVQLVTPAAPDAQADAHPDAHPDAQGARDGDGGAFETMHLFCEVNEEERAAEAEEDGGARETDRAVAGMQAVVLDSEFGEDTK